MKSKIILSFVLFLSVIFFLFTKPFAEINNNSDSPPAYSNAVIQRIDDNKNHGLRSIMDRPKIEYLVFGQKSEYQCEDVSKVDPNFWYYTYNEHHAGQNYQDNTQFGNNQWVKFCDSDPDNPGATQGYVVKNLKANREQAPVTS